MRPLLLALFICLSTNAAVQENIQLSLGMLNASFSENPSSLEDSNSEPASGTSSVIAMDIQYNFIRTMKKNFFASISFPLIGSSGSAIYRLASGIDIFWADGLNGNYNVTKGEDSINYYPKMRYFWGGSIGANYLVYSTQTATKSDILADIGAHAGLIYNFSKKYEFKGKFSFSRGVGVATSTMLMQVFGGVIYYF
ncbi:MAG: hypothetical protein N4A33_10540 [Bacteriovoracaceae bacterium]|nr:hypothetical protein [Bacteriovoracaceae bacterium]